MAVEQGAAIQSYNNELVRLLQVVERQRRCLQAEINDGQHQKADLEVQLKSIKAKLEAVNADLEAKLERRRKCDKMIQETKTAHQRIMESSQVLVNVLKKDLKDLNIEGEICGVEDNETNNGQD